MADPQNTPAPDLPRSWPALDGEGPIKTILEGGCYWPWPGLPSPGHSIVLPNGTPFVILVEGPRSNVFCHGTCRDGYYVPTDGEFAGRKFASASAVVNTVRKISTNAFLYLEFAIDGDWILADDLRRSADFRSDEIEESALQEALGVVRRAYSRKKMEEVEAVKRAAELVATKPIFMDHARNPIELDLDLMRQ